MTVIDFIDVIDDIIDLSSDEETVQQDHIATQPPARLVDSQAVFVLAGEVRQDAQAAFVSAGEGSQEATESAFVEQDHIATQPPATLVDWQDVFALAGEGRQDAQVAFVSAGERSQEATESENALVATASPSVTEQTPLHAAVSQNCPCSPTAPFSSPISTTPKALSSDVGDTEQDVFVLAGEGRQDAQAAFVLAGEGSQRAAESKNALVATASPSATEQMPLHTAESQSCPSSPTAPFSSPTFTTPMVLASEVGDKKQDVFALAGEGRQDAQAAFFSAGEGSQEATESVNALVATALPLVMENVPLDTAELKSYPSFPTSAPLHSPASATSKALTSEDGDTQLVATVSPSDMEKAPLDTAESKNFPSSLASVPLPSPTSTTPNALTSEDGGTKPVRANYTKKNYHTSTPRRSPRLREYSNSSVEELSADHKRSRMLEPAEESAAPLDDAKSSKTLYTDTATKKDVFALAGEGTQDAKTAFVSAGEGSQETTESVNALVATALPLVMERVPLGTAESKGCPSSPTSAPLPCPASTTMKTLASEDGDTKLVRVKHPKKNYHTSTPRKSPRLREGCNNPVEELAASPKRSCMLEPTEESVFMEPSKSLSTDSASKKDVFVLVGEGRQDANTAFVSAGEGSQETAESVNALVATALPVSTAESKSSQTSAPLPCQASTTLKALASEDGDTKLVRVKHPKKNYHTSTPRKSPRLGECCNNPVEELAAGHKTTD